MVTLKVLSNISKRIRGVANRSEKTSEHSFYCPASKICSLGRSNSKLSVLVSEHVGESASLTQLLISERRNHDRFISNLSFDLRSRVHNMLGLLSLAAETEARLSDPALLRLLQKEFSGLMNVSDRIGSLLEGVAPQDQQPRQIPLSALCDAQIGQRLQSLLEVGTEIVATYSRDLPANLVGDVIRTEHIVGCALDICLDKFEGGKLNFDVSMLPGSGSKRRVRFSLKFEPRAADSHSNHCPFNAIEVQNRAARIGMNMVIAERIVDQLGGVFSWHGSGTSIAELSFELPFTVPASAVNSPVTSLTNGKHPSKLELTGSTVLVVDDDAVARKIVEHMLRRNGCLVTTADDGASAICTAEYALFDFILMDCKMPELDGLEASRQIRQLPGHNDVTILGMTAQVFPGDREKCLEAGMDEVLAKPFSEQELVEAMLRYQAQRRRAAIS